MDTEPNIYLILSSLIQHHCICRWFFCLLRPGRIRSRRLRSQVSASGLCGSCFTIYTDTRLWQRQIRWHIALEMIHWIRQADSVTRVTWHWWPCDHVTRVASVTWSPMCHPVSWLHCSSLSSCLPSYHTIYSKKAVLQWQWEETWSQWRGWSRGRVKLLQYLTITICFPALA